MKVNIVLAADEKYSRYCMVTLTSILENTTSFIDVYIMTSFFSEMTKRRFMNYESSYKCKIHFVIIDEATLQGVPLPKELSHINIVTYYRLLISSVLPNGIDNIIYLDCDIIVRHDIAELASIPIDGYAISAVMESPYEDRRDRERLHIPLEYGYFNAGVLLINLSYWREHKLESVFLSYLNNNSKNILYHDQDVLNATLYDKTLAMPVTWNTLPVLYVRSKMSPEKIKAMRCILSDPALVHFVYVPKPWQPNCNNPWKAEYEKYCLRAGISDLLSKDTIIFRLKSTIQKTFGKFFNFGYLSLKEL